MPKPNLAPEPTPREMARKAKTCPVCHQTDAHCPMARKEVNATSHHAHHVCKEDPCLLQPDEPSIGKVEAALSPSMAARLEELKGWIRGGRDEIEKEEAKTASILVRADALVNGDRQQTYGHPLDNYEPTAELMTTYLRTRYGVDIELDFTDVVRFFQFAKMMREASPNGIGMEAGYDDNEMDVVGYSGVRELCIRETIKRKAAACSPRAVVGRKEAP